MFVGKRLAGFQFHQEFTFHHQIGKILSEQRAILVEYLQGSLGLHAKTGFAQAVHEGILVDLLQMAVPVVDMNGVGRFAHNVAEFLDRFHRAEITMR
jgi:hypothetical protein